jgi:hypothetical protein
MQIRGRRELRQLFLISAGSLFLELVLIRLLASEIRVFAYFKNFPLLAAFIGLGVGCYVADKRPIRLWLSPLILLLLTLCAVFSQSLHLANLFFPDPALYIFRGSILSPNLVEQARAYPIIGQLYGHVSNGWLLAAIGVTSFAIMTSLFAATAAVFLPLGQLTGLYFRGQQPLTAYSINVSGSLLGSLLFTSVSYLELGPSFWLVPSFALLAFFGWSLRQQLATVISAVAALVLLVALPFTTTPGERVVWSPYYRINLVPGVPETAAVPNGNAFGWTLLVNHDYFQRAVDLRPAAVHAAPKLLPVAQNYDLPYRLIDHYDRVLVVGSGMGNDVAAALRAGAGAVTAVDIDPAIIRLGKELHPENPLGNPRVRTVVDDARAFFQKQSRSDDTGRYDLAVFGLLDSHTARSSMSSVRLEFFVYTVESIREALSLVDERHGIAAITFSVGWRDWVGARLFRSIAEASGRDPIALALPSVDYDGGVTFLAGPGIDRIDRARLATFGAQDVSARYRIAARANTDDWPFLYLHSAHWPWVYVLAILLVLIVGVVMVRRAMRHVGAAAPTDARTVRFDWHMFLMGAAFMLVETGAIARLSLLFGSTWIVNAAVISAVLLMILGANALVEFRKAPSVQASYVLLCASLVLIYFTPFAIFSSIPGGRALASALVALPVLFSGLVFARVFATVPSAHMAFGCNMLGALVGGALEAVSLATGIRALSLLAFVLYMGSAIILVRRSRAEAPVLSSPLPEPGT